MEPRKHYLDWLRVIAFALLILFHVGCLYASWPYNLKSPQPHPEVDWLLLALTPWRMPLLFLISGVAARYFVVRFGAGRFALDRVRRLVPVILVGMFVVIPPQTYAFLLDHGAIHQNYLHFWVFSYLAADEHLIAPFHRTMPTYDHLWFIVYLLLYALVLALVFALGRGVRFVLARTPVPVRPSRIPLPAVICLPALWLILTTFAMERIVPQTFWIANDWGAHLKFGGMFALGAMLATHAGFWEFVRARRDWLIASAAGFLTLQSVNHVFYLTGKVDPLLSAVLWSLSSGLFAWTMLCGACGYAAQYLNRPSAVLRHLNEAILPVYVLHQPLLLVSAYLIFPLRLPLGAEVTTLITATGFGSYMIYLTLIRPFRVMRFLFGLRPQHRSAADSQRQVPSPPIAQR